MNILDRIDEHDVVEPIIAPLPVIRDFPPADDVEAAAVQPRKMREIGDVLDELKPVSLDCVLG